MVNLSTDPPKEYGAGLEFNYAVWNATTELTLCNVPWNNNYRDIVKFPDVDALDKYINDKTGSNKIRIDNASYAPVNKPIRIPMSYNIANQYNYIRATNPYLPTGNDNFRSYYYFIIGVNFIAPGTTEIIVQLDLWQTFNHKLAFGNCYIERGHIGIANVDQFQDYGRKNLTIPEGLDVGGEYTTVMNNSVNVLTTRDVQDEWQNGMPYPINGAQYNILVASTVDLRKNAGDVNDPKLNSAKGGMFSGLPHGASYYIFENADLFSEWLEKMADKPWVTRGIISVKVVPRIQNYFPLFVYGNSANGELFKEAPRTVPRQYLRNMAADWRNEAIIYKHIPERYRHLRKFWTFPYMVIELTTFTGSPVILKPESWQTRDAGIRELVSIVPPNERMVFSPIGYNAPTGWIADARYPELVGRTDGPYIDGILITERDGDDGGDYLDIQTQIANFPTMALVNDGAIGFLAANNYSINQEYRNADWSQERARAGASTAYGQANSGMAASGAQYNAGRQLDASSTNITNATIAEQAMQSAMMGIGGGMINGAMAGPPGVAAGAIGGTVSAVGTALSANTQQGANTQQYSARSVAGNSSFAAQQQNAAYLRDTNNELANFAAQGDYAATVGSLNAKVRDAQLTQPSTSGQVGGEAFLLVNNEMKISIRFKMLDSANLKRVGEYWLMYGYAVQQFGNLPESLMVMTKFTYWKLSETYLTYGFMPESFKQAVRGIFEKGVTVWKNPDDIGNIDWADNKPLDGVRL